MSGGWLNDRNSVPVVSSSSCISMSGGWFIERNSVPVVSSSSCISGSGGWLNERNSVPVVSSSSCISMSGGWFNERKGWRISESSSCICMAGWLDRRFKDLKLIGQGAFEDVYRCIDMKNNNSVVAVKHIPFGDEGFPGSILREISAHKNLNHPNVVRLLDVIEGAKCVKLVLEYLNNDLGRFIKGVSKLDPHLIKSFLFQILQGVSYCHSKKILHRDLKPENLLLDVNTLTIKIADFGHTRKADAAASVVSRDVTTVQYNAPEILERAPQNTTAVDIWSVGCIFAEVVKGVPLFSGDLDHIVLTKIISVCGVPSELKWKGVTLACLNVLGGQTLPSHKWVLPDLFHEFEPKGIELLTKMLCFLPSERISASDALKHPYFEDFQLNQ